MSRIWEVNGKGVSRILDDTVQYLLKEFDEKCNLEDFGAKHFGSWMSGQSGQNP